MFVSHYKQHHKQIEEYLAGREKVFLRPQNKEV